LDKADKMGLADTADAVGEAAVSGGEDWAGLVAMMEGKEAALTVAAVVWVAVAAAGREAGRERVAEPAATAILEVQALSEALEGTAAAAEVEVKASELKVAMATGAAGEGMAAEATAKDRERLAVLGKANA